MRSVRYLLSCFVVGLLPVGQVLASPALAAGRVALPTSVSVANAAAPADGVGTGLTASYFNNGTLAGKPLVKRVDAAVDFKWDIGSPAPGVRNDNFSVRWEGQLQAPANGRYTFAIASNDGVRLWVNGKKIIDTWDAPGPNAKNTGTANLAAGQFTSIKLEYYDQEGEATIRLQWMPPGQASQIIPTANLFPTDELLTPAVADAPAPAPATKAEPAAKEPKAAKELKAVAEKPAKEPAKEKAPKAEKVAKAPAPEKAAEAPAPAPLEPVTLPGVFTLLARSDGKALEVLDSSRPNPALGLTNTTTNTDAPQWQIESSGNGYYRLVVQGGRKVLEVLGSSTSNGAALELWPYYSGNNQQWAIEQVEGGFYKLTAKHSGKALTSNTEEEGGLQQRRYSGRPTQQWKLEPVVSQATAAIPIPSNVAAIGSNKLTVYPNPSNGVVQMAYQLPTEQPMGWVLYDQRGVAVRVSDYRRQKAGAHHQTLDLTTLPAGDYNLNLTVGTTITKQPLLIRRALPDAPETSAGK